MNRGEMRGFIQAIYGGVLGVSSFNFLARLKNDEHQIVELATKANLFDLLFFLVTLLIIAHDWFSFHSNDLKKEKCFIEYVPEMIGLLLMAQMFATANHSDIRYWFLFGAGYTFCNFINLRWGKYLVDKSKAFKEWKDNQIAVHFLITTIGFFVMKRYEHVKIETNLALYYSTLLITFLIVIGFWIKVDGIRNSDDEKREKEALEEKIAKDQEAETMATELNKSIGTVVKQYLKKEKDGRKAAKDTFLEKLGVLKTYEAAIAAGTGLEYLKTHPQDAELIKKHTSSDIFFNTEFTNI